MISYLEPNLLKGSKQEDWLTGLRLGPLEPPISLELFPEAPLKNLVERVWKPLGQIPINSKNIQVKEEPSAEKPTSTKSQILIKQKTMLCWS